MRALTTIWELRIAIGRSLLFSLLYSFATVATTFVMCLYPAKALAYENFRFKPLLEGMLLAPALVPSMTFSMGIHLAFLRIGLADTFIGVVCVLSLFSYPYMLRALCQGFETFGNRFALCARNLGASPLRVLVLVELPLLVPSIIAGGSVVFLVAFSEYFLVFLIGGGIVPSFAGYLFPFLNSSDHATASALTLLFFLPPILLFTVVQFLTHRIYRRRGIY